MKKYIYLCLFFLMPYHNLITTNIVTENRMRLYTFYTPLYEVFKDRWFLPTLQDNYEIIIEKYEQECPLAIFMGTGWNRLMHRKIDLIIRAIHENWEKLFIYADIDIQFFKPTEKIIIEQMKNNDLLIQRDDPAGTPCAGFFICRGNKKTLQLWTLIKKNIDISSTTHNDQTMLTLFIKHKNPLKIKWDYLPATFLSGGTLTGKIWNPGHSLSIPSSIVLHHANWTIGTKNKIAQLEYVRNKISSSSKQSFFSPNNIT